MASALEDAKRIRSAIKGLGTDDKVLVEIIPHRTTEQLQQVANEYVGSFGIKLADDIKGDTSGNYRDLLIGLVESKPLFLAKAIHEAVAGAGTDDAALIDCVVHQPNYVINEVKAVYHTQYHKHLVDDIRGDTSGDYKKLLTGLLNATRDESNQVNHEAAVRDAEHLYKKGEGKIGTDEEAFIEFFLRSSWLHIREVDRVYTEKHKHSLATAIGKEFSGNIKKTLKALATPRAEYWAGRIYSSVSGLGTNDKLLIRAFVLNHDRMLMREIEAAYGARHAKKHGKDKKGRKHVSGALRDDIKGDTSGWYEKTLLALLD